MSQTYPEQNFLLVSTDPAHSLVDSLEKNKLPQNLTALEFDAQASLATFKAENRQQLAEIANRGTFLDDEDINQFLDLSLPGMDELMAFLQISEWIRQECYHCIIMDTAPTGHTLRLLSMPELIRPWLAALDVLLGKHRYMKNLFAGHYEPDDVDNFLLDLSASVCRLDELLQDEARALFVPVLLAESFSVKETARLLNALNKMNIKIHDVVVNKLYPVNNCPVCQQERYRQQVELDGLKTLQKNHNVWGLPLNAEEIKGTAALAALWGTVEPVCFESPVPVANKAKTLTPLVEPLRGLPLPQQKLLLFAGKGGVGKTTLACATAARLAKAGNKVLLFSTDPAHSLADCLDSPVGGQPTKVSVGLDAMEIDGEAEFAELKEHYAAELEALLDQSGSTLDFAFDREVLDRMLDLSPPGLDEVMALLTGIEFLFADQYDILVLDAAPTGHLIRLLEMPELVNDWLRVFFKLFLKYNTVLKLPKISAQMVQMSKEIKRLRRLLQNTEQSSLCAVTILTEMAAAETEDLVVTCQNMGVSVPVLFCNMVTPANDCPFCAKLCNQEYRVKKGFDSTFAAMTQVSVFRQQEPKGIDRLTALGDELYQV